jgi:hypothetical protein
MPMQKRRDRIESLADLTGHSADLAGPPAMVEAALPALQARGMLAEYSHADAFYDDPVMKRRTGDTVSPEPTSGSAPTEG